MTVVWIYDVLFFLNVFYCKITEKDWNGQRKWRKNEKEL